MTYKIKATKRDIFGKKLGSSRAQGLTPAVIYGPEVKENINIFLPKNEIQKLYQDAGASSLINLELEGEKEPREVLIKDAHLDPVRDELVHLDFYQVKRGQKLDVEVELNFIGEAPAVKNLHGILIKNLNEIEVRCLPKDMISEISVELSSLATFEDKILVKDLKIPETLEVLIDPDELVTMVAEPAKEEKDEKPAEEEAEGEESAEGEEKPAEEGEAKEGEEKPEKEPAKEEAEKK